MSNIWTEQRLRLMNQLQMYSSDLAELYRTAIDFLGSSTEAIDAACMSVISHCMREIMNAIFDFVIPDSNLPSRGQLHSELKNDLKVLDSRWEEFKDQSISAEDASGQDVPLGLIHALQNYYQGNNRREEVNNQKRSLLVLNDSNANHPAVTAWKHAHDFFQSKTHVSVDRKPTKSKEVFSHIEIFELCISARLGLFFNTASGIEAIAVQANVKNAGDYVSPSKESVDMALAGLVSHEHRRLFFHILENPHWALELLNRDYFVQTAKLARPQAHWPEVGYLYRMAAVVPVHVMKIINGVIKLRIPARTMECIECLSSLPIDGAKCIESEVIDQLEDGTVHNLTTDALDSLCSHINHLLRGGRKAQKRGRSLFYTLFEAKKSLGELMQSDKGVESLVPYCYFREQIESALYGLPISCRMPLLQKLIITYNNAIERDASHITSVLESHYTRPEIAHAEAYMQYDYGNNLIDYVRDVFINECLEDDNALRGAWDSNDSLVRRIVLHVVGVYLERCVNNELPITRSYIDFVQYLIDIASTLLDDYDPELIPLICICSSLRNKIDMSRFFKSLEVYRQQKYEKFLSVEKQSVCFNELDEGYARKWADHSEYRLLALIGEENLTGKLADRLRDYRQRYGKTDFSPRIGPRTIMPHGYHSPLSVDEINSMSHQELLRFLEEWDSNGYDFERPSKYGLAIKLGESAADCPAIIEDLLHKLGDSCSLYAANLLTGLDKAVDMDKPIPVNEVLAYMKSQLNNSLNYALIKQCVRLLRRASNQVVNEDSIALECIELLERCCNSNGVKGEEDEQLANLREAKHAASSSLRPSALRTLAIIAADNCTDVVREQALRAFYGVAKSDDSIVLGAAIGLSIDYALQADWDMAIENRDSLFGQIAISDMQKCACASAFSGYWHNSRLLKFFYPVVYTALSEPIETDVSKDLNYVLPLGQNLLYGYISNYMDYSDKLFQKWHEVAGVDIRKSVLRTACRLAGAEGTKRGIVSMVMRYWDLRAEAIKFGGCPEEMTGIFLLAHNTAIGIDWLLPRMRMEAECNPNPDDAAIVMERLAEASEGHEEDVLMILKALYDASTETSYLFRHDLTIAAVPTLARALKLENQDLKEKALCFVDLLGSAGYIEIDKQIREFNNW